MEKTDQKKSPSFWDKFVAIVFGIMGTAFCVPGLCFVFGTFGMLTGIPVIGVLAVAAAYLAASLNIALPIVFGIVLVGIGVAAFWAVHELMNPSEDKKFPINVPIESEGEFYNKNDNGNNEMPGVNMSKDKSKNKSLNGNKDSD